MERIAIGFLASLLAGLMTGVGALPVLFERPVSQRLSDVMLAFAAGVMLGASFFSLILPGIEVARAEYGGDFVPALIAAGGMLLGVAAMAVLNDRLPHEHFFQGREGPVVSEAVGRVGLFVIAITIHNAPEGLAVGVGFGGGDIARGTTLALGIGLQNVPEGLAVALALLSIGYGRTRSFAIAAMTGLVEPVTGLLGAFAAGASVIVLPWALTFAAGAMIYVISHEIIPDTHRHGFATQATLGLSAGLAVMMLLDLTL